MTPTRTHKPDLIMLGAGGHAKVLLALAQVAGYRVVGVCDPQLTRAQQEVWRGISVLGDDDALTDFPEPVGLINGFGQVVGSEARAALYGRMVHVGFHFPPLIHPTAWLAPTVQIADGVQVMASAVVQPDSCVGENTIINTGAQVDHDCQIGAHVHIAPGAILCGGVWLGRGVFIGAGATILPGVRVEKDAVVGAGLTLRHDLIRGQIFTGIRKTS